MSMISIEVDAQTAQAFAAADAESRRKLELLLALRLRELTSVPPRVTGAIMDEMSRRAEAAGLTAQGLEMLLDGQ